MPIDPMIANPATVKINDPMEQYGNYLKDAYLVSEIDKAKRDAASTNALNDAYTSAVGSDGTVNRNALYQTLATKKVGSKIPSVMKEFADADKASAETGKFNADAMKARGDAFGQLLTNTKSMLAGIDAKNPATGLQQYAAHMSELYKQPEFQAYLASAGKTSDQSFQQDMAEALQAAKSGNWGDFILGKQIGVDKQAKQHYENLDLGGHRQLLALPEYASGTPQPTLLSDQKITESPNRPKQTTNVQVSVNAGAKGLNAYQEAMGKGHAAQDLALEKAAQEAGPAIDRIHSIRSVIRNGHALTGPLAGLFLKRDTIAKSLGATGFDQEIADTQVLQSQIAQDSLANIARLHNEGVSLTPLSDSDRKFLLSAGAQNNHDPATIDRILSIEEKMHRSAQEKFAQSDRLRNENSFTATGRKMVPPNHVAPAQKANFTPLNAPQIQGTNGKMIHPDDVADLRANPQHAGDFDAFYGAGSAKRVLGGK